MQGQYVVFFDREGYSMKAKSVLTGLIILMCLSTGVVKAQKVACVGDSITYGAGIGNRAKDSYPAQLGQRLLAFGSTWETRNFGVNSATLLHNGDLPYVELAAYTQAREWNPDIVIIMLGTNDTKPVNWAHKDEFVSDYLALIDAFAALPSQPKIWVCKPVPAFNDTWGIRDQVITEEIIPFIDEIASLRDVGVIDMHTPLLDAGEFFPDTIHPDATGAGLMVDVLVHVLINVRHVPDFNRDGHIDLLDFARLAQHDRLTHLPEPNTVPIQDRYDLSPVPDGDGAIDLRDYAGLFQFWLMTPGFLAHWTLDETEGVIAQDAVGTAHGTVMGDALWQPSGGSIGGTLELDGVDDYVRTEFVLNPADGPFTVFVWVKGGLASEVILSQTDTRGYSGTWLGADPLGGRLMTDLTDAGRVTRALVSEFVITDDVWHQIRLVWDGTLRHLFVDDVEVAADVRALAPLVSSRGGMHMGAAKTPGGGTFWTGFIDDIRVYDGALLP
jgi:lysophospholipase L1-like esterase